MEVIKTQDREDEQKLGAKVKFISNSFRRIADESTHELGITGVQSFLLGYLYNFCPSPPCQHDIEVRFNIKHPTATGLLTRLEEKGYVRFTPDKFDRRMKRIELTEEGESAARRTKSRLDELDERLERGFTPEELRTLHSLLDRVVENAKSSGGRCRHQEGE